MPYIQQYRMDIVANIYTVKAMVKIKDTIKTKRNIPMVLILAFDEQDL